jgi:hypothetical protein
MPEAAHPTPVLERLWAALDELLDAAEITPAHSELELSIDTAIRQVARAIIPAKEAAMLEQLASERGVGAETG